MAITSGPAYAGTVVDDSTIGSVAWTDPTLAEGSGGIGGAQVSLSGGQISHYIKATNFGGFSDIPAGSTIIGITAEFDLDASINSRGTIYSVKIIKAGTIVGTDLGDSTGITTAQHYYIYGGTNNLWGTTFALSSIQASNFGVVLAVTAVSSLTIACDHIRLSVTYTPPNQSVMLTSVASAGDIGTPTISPKNTVGLTGVASNAAYGLPSISNANLPFSTLQDNFNDNSIDTTLWTVSNIGVGTTTETSGALQLKGAANNSGLNYGVLLSKTVYDLTDTSVSVKVAQYMNTAINFGDASFAVYPSGQSNTNRYDWFFDGISIIARKRVAGVLTTLYSSSSLTDKVYLRIGETSGTVSFDTSADGISWTQRATTTTSNFPVTALLLDLDNGTYASTPTAGIHIFENVNIFTQQVSLTGVASAGVVGLPTVNTRGQVILTGVAGNGAVGTPTVTRGANVAHEVVETSSNISTSATNEYIEFRGIESDIESWITSTAQNYGWLVVSTNETSASADNGIFSAREDGNAPPELLLQFYDYIQPRTIYVDKGLYAGKTVADTGTGHDDVRITKISMDDYILGKQGPINYTFGVRHYTREGVFIEDISEDIENVKIDWDETKDVKRSLSFDIKSQIIIDDSDLLEPYAILTMLSPLSYEELSTEFIFGRYTKSIGKNSIGLSFNSRSVTAGDRTSLLVDTTINVPYTVNSGASYGAVIRTLAIAAGFKDEDVLTPYTSVTVPTTLTWKQGTTYYEIIRQLADAVNWYPPYMDNQDKLRIDEMQDNSLAIANVTYATDDDSMILPTVNMEMATTKIPNKIVVSVDDPLRTPFTVTYTNNNTDNPYSLTNTGDIITQVVDNIDYMASSGIALTRAALVAQQVSSVSKLELKTWVDVRRKPHEIYTLHIIDPETDEVVFFSNWRCVAWSMSLQTGGEMSHQLRSILPV